MPFSWLTRRLPSDLPCCAALPHLGLDIRRHHLRLAVVRRRRSAFDITALAEHRFATPVCQDGQLGDLEQITQACARLLHAHGIARGVVHMALPAPATPQWQLTLPASSPAHARMAQVRADCLLRLGSAAAQAVLDYRDGAAASTSRDESTLAIACCPAMLVEDRQALASALRLHGGVIGLQEHLSAALLRRRQAGATLLHLAPDAAWLMHGQRLHLLVWRPAQTLPALLLELAPHLQPAPAQLLLTGELAQLPGLPSALLRYAGVQSAIARPCPAQCVPPVFHDALALATAQPA